MFAFLLWFDGELELWVDVLGVYIELFLVIFSKSMAQASLLYNVYFDLLKNKVSVIIL